MFDGDMKVLSRGSKAMEAFEYPRLVSQAVKPGM
jgi:hypothetical protein